MVNNKNKKQIFKYIVWSFMTVLGTFIMSVGFTTFLVPNNIVSGGFSGISFLISEGIYRWTGVTIKHGLIYIIINAPLYIISYKQLGREFFFSALLGMLSFSFFMDIAHFNIGVNDAMLCSIFGGMLYGLGLGIVVRASSSTGGTDLLGNILHKINYHITVGTCVQIIDVMIIILNSFLSGIVYGLYGMVAILISGFVCDYINQVPRAVKAYYVISDKYEEISEAVIYELHRGVTALSTEGVFSHKERKMLLVVISRRQINDMNTLVYSIDPNAFTFITDCKDAIGNGFNKPRHLRKSSELYRVVTGDDITKEPSDTSSRPRKHFDKK